MTRQAEEPQQADTSRTARTGRFVYHVTADAWWWSDQFFTILGFSPGDLVPSGEVLLAHCHPADVERVRENLGRLTAGRTVSCYHRLTDASGRGRTALLVGHTVVGADADAEVHGYLVDLSDARRDDSRQDVAEAVTRATEHRAIIDQAKGVLMATHGVSSEEAFALLANGSQHANLKLRELARLLVEAVGVTGLPEDPTDPVSRLLRG